MSIAYSRMMSVSVGESSLSEGKMAGGGLGDRYVGSAGAAVVRC